MDLNHTRLPIPPPERIPPIGTTPIRENRDIIYSLPGVLQMKKSVFFQNTPRKTVFSLKKERQTTDFPLSSTVFRR